MSLVSMNIAISGASGLIGSELANRLREDGHRVVALVRSEHEATDDQHCWWDPDRGIQQLNKLEGLDAVIHLAGRSIADHRWTDAEKELLRSSRVDATEQLCKDLLKLNNQPSTFLAASAVGYYGDCGSEQVTEQHAPGSDFLARLGVDWEAASASVQSIGTRVMHARFGVVLSPKGGALAKILPLFRWGLGSSLGNGQQYWSWISLEDTVGALRWLLMNDQCEGAFNFVAPDSVTNATFTRELARAVHRPRFLPVPAFALRLVIGEMADAALLSSCRAQPKRLLECGYKFAHPTLTEALEALL